MILTLSEVSVRVPTRRVQVFAIFGTPQDRPFRCCQCCTCRSIYRLLRALLCRLMGCTARAGGAAAGRFFSPETLQLMELLVCRLSAGVPSAVAVLSTPALHPAARRPGWVKACFSRGSAAALALLASSWFVTRVRDSERFPMALRGAASVFVTRGTCCVWLSQQRGCENCHFVTPFLVHRVISHFSVTANVCLSQ